MAHLDFVDFARPAHIISSLSMRSGPTLAALAACSVALIAALVAYLSAYTAAYAAEYDVAVEPVDLGAWAVLGHALPVGLREPGAATTLAFVSVRTPLWRVLLDGLVVGGGSIACTVANGNGVPFLKVEEAGGTLPMPLTWTGAPWARSIGMEMELALPITHGAVLEALRYVAPWLLSAHFEVSSGVVESGSANTDCRARALGGGGGEGEGGGGGGGGGEGEGEGEGEGNGYVRECARRRRGALLKLDGRMTYPGLAAGPNEQPSYHATALLEPGSLVVAATPLSPQEVATAREQRAKASAESRAGAVAAYGLARYRSTPPSPALSRPPTHATPRRPLTLLQAIRPA